MNLNQRAYDRCQRLLADAERLRVAERQATCGTRLIDCGIEAPGGLEAGVALAEVCMADLGRVQLVPASAGFPVDHAIAVATDHPLAACMAAQYAGWQVASGKFFAMGSGPMRAAAGKEELLKDYGLLESASVAVGVLETRQFPPDEVCRDLAAQCRVPADRLTLLLAPTASLAGTVQVLARSVETALHKLHALGFDLRRVGGGCGLAPLAPAGRDDLAAIGLTNDAVLYGGQATLWVRGDDESLAEIGPKVPSAASPDFGEPFAEIFERYERDFYKIDPHLFSPAQVTFHNVDTGRTLRCGWLQPDILERSFGIVRP